MKEDTFLVGSTIMSIIIFVGIIILACFISSCNDGIKYNNGVHEADGGKWIYEQAIGHRYATYYLYRCNKCGKLIEVDIEPTVFREN